MKIKGFEKFTLIDYPNKIACTLFLFGCNLRCGFCHNPELVLEETSNDISEKSILKFLEKRKGQLEGVCICGGEPLLTLDENFLEEIKKIGYSIKIDTNGCFPEKLKKLVDKNLVDFIAVDIKASEEKYDKIAGAKVDFEKIKESVKIVDELEEYELRTTVIEGIHDIEEIKKIGKMLNKILGKKPKKFVLQGFNNHGKFVDNSYKNKKNTSEEFLNELKEVAEDYFEKVSIRI